MVNGTSFALVCFSLAQGQFMLLLFFFSIMLTLENTNLESEKVAAGITSFSICLTAVVPQCQRYLLVLLDFGHHLLPRQSSGY